MRKQPVKLNQLPYDAEFLNALGELEQRIFEDYKRFQTAGGKKELSPVSESMYNKFVDGLEYLPGNKYLKVVTESSLWGFINLKHDKFNEGDLLKAQGWSGPALNKARGNIFDNNYEIRWTGPLYLR